MTQPDPAQPDQTPAAIADNEDVPRAAPGTAEVAARPAASLLVMRRDTDAVRLLMARRGPGHRFMPNMLVFPGGAVDRADHAAPAASEPRDEVLARLMRGAEAGLARALAVAVARELEEEVGLSLGAPPHLAALEYFCRAITPPDRVMRFDARFFLVDAAHVSGQLRASDEMEAPGWYTVDEALAADSPGATKAVLMQFSEYLAGGGLADRVPVLRDRRWVLE